MLFDRSEPAYRLPLSYIVPATIVTSLFFLFVVGKGLRAQKLPIKAGKETMIGKTVEALSAIDSRGGRVFIEGENWSAVSERPVGKGELVEVTAVQGLKLKVVPKATGITQ